MEKQLFGLDNLNAEELLTKLGEQIRTLRIRQNVSQITFAERAGISVAALKNLESGKGATLTTFVRALRALGRADWLERLSPAISISPLQLLNSPRTRLKASSPRKKSAK